MAKADLFEDVAKRAGLNAQQRDELERWHGGLVLRRRSLIERTWGKKDVDLEGEFAAQARKLGLSDSQQAALAEWYGAAATQAAASSRSCFGSAVLPVFPMRPAAT